MLKVISYICNFMYLYRWSSALLFEQSFPVKTKSQLNSSHLFIFVVGIRLHIWISYQFAGKIKRLFLFELWNYIQILLHDLACMKYLIFMWAVQKKFSASPDLTRLCKLDRLSNEVWKSTFDSIFSHVFN